MNVQNSLAGVAIAFLLVSCANTPPSSSTESNQSTTPSASSEKTEPEDVVELTPEAQRRIGIVVTPVRESLLAVPLRVTGSVQPIDSRMGHVRPLARGRVQQVLVRMGDRVSTDQGLALFDNMEAGELATEQAGARGELARLRVQLANVTRQAERSRKLGDIGAVPQKEVEASLSEQQQLEESVRSQESKIAGMDARLQRYGLSATTPREPSSVTTVRAPFDGVVTHIAAAPGDVVDPSSELFTIADITRVYVQAQVYEKDLGHVRLGQTATITVDAYPAEHFVGSVAAIGDTVDTQTRTVAVRCDVSNSKGLLKLDMFATVDLSTDSNQPALVVPTEAIQTLDRKTVVFVRSTASRFAVRPVETGRSSGTLTEVLHGLKPGESVVTSGAFQVKSSRLAKELGEKE
jgi:cobalt-zinc-cadmium efflux system membrane fusion protein